MHKNLYLSFLLLISTTVFSQDFIPRRNALFIEAGGNGLFTSVNYERRLTSANKGFAFRIGVGMYAENGLYLTIPFTVHYMFPLNNRGSYLDSGTGITGSVMNTNDIFKGDEDSFTSFTGVLGWRKYSRNGNRFFRVAFTPVINKYGFVPWLGIGIGFTNL